MILIVYCAHAVILLFLGVDDIQFGQMNVFLPFNTPMQDLSEILKNKTNKKKFLLSLWWAMSVHL